MTEEQKILAQLHDLHPPDSVSAWPPGPAWWLLLGTLLTLAVLTWLGLRYYRRRHYRRQALALLRTSERRWQHEPCPHTLLTDLNQLLRRTALVAYPQSQVAGLQGEAWLDFLDRTGGAGQFRQGVGKILAQGPYQPHCTLDAPTDVPALIKLVRQWIKRHR